MFAGVINAVRAISTDKKDAAMVEYGLLIGLIALACVAAITLIGSDIAEAFGQISTAVATA